MRFKFRYLKNRLLTTLERKNDHRKNSRMYWLWNMYRYMPHRRHPQRPKDGKSIHRVSGRLPDMSLMQDVLSCGCNHHFTGEIYSGCSFMGVEMSPFIKSSVLRQSVLVFAGMPLLIWVMGNFPERSVLKESFSVMTILAFCQMMGQFFWARANRSVVAELKMRKVIKYHKFIGYTFVSILFFHPLYLVIPRFFESGVSPADAFITIITTLNQGVVLGIIAWCMMLTLGITSFARKKLPLKYKTWRVFHGILAMLFIFTATWHVIDLGRHSNLAMSILIIMLTAGGGLLLLKTYTFKNQEKPSEV